MVILDPSILDHVLQEIKHSPQSRSKLLRRWQHLRNWLISPPALKALHNFLDLTMNSQTLFTASTSICLDDIAWITSGIQYPKNHQDKIEYFQTVIVPSINQGTSILGSKFYISKSSKIKCQFFLSVDFPFLCRVRGSGICNCKYYSTAS